MMNEKKRPEYPTLDEGTYAEDVERGIAEAEKKAAEIERQAKRDRDMALIGDMAHLVSQGAAMHGGAWKIGQTQNEGTKGNERLRALREKNAAQTAAFAKERAALREAKRKEQNALKLARFNAEVEQYKRDLEAEKYAKEQERKDRQEARQIAESTAKINYYNNGGRRTAGGGSGASNTPMPITFPNGRVKTFSEADNGDNWVNVAYEEAVAAGMPRLMRERTDAFGDTITYEATSLAERKAYMERWSAENAKNNTVEDWTPEEDEIIDYKP